MLFRVLLVSAALLPVATAQAQPQASGVDAELQRARGLRAEQRYREALPVVEAMRARDDLSAQNRLDVLRELALLRLILRDDAGAREAFTAAFARDPGFDLGPGDHPPRFERALQEARATPPASPVTIAPPVVQAAAERATFEVRVERGADAIASIVVLVRGAGATTFSELVLEGRPAQGSVAASPGELAYYVEVRAPSGAVLARADSAGAPATLRIPRAPAAHPASARRAPAGRVAVVPAVQPPGGHPSAHEPSGGGLPAWVWIAGGVVVVAGATTAGVLLATPDAPRDGTWGHAELGR